MRKIIITLAIFCMIFSITIMVHADPEGGLAYRLQQIEDAKAGKTNTEKETTLDIQSEVSKRIKSGIEYRMRDAGFYDDVEFDSLNLVLEDDDYIKSLQMHFIWDVDNSKERTIKMLEMYSDDIVEYIVDTYSDNYSFNEIWIFWEDFYVTQTGNAAKYKYPIIGTKIYAKESYGALYGKD